MPLLWTLLAGTAFGMRTDKAQAEWIYREAAIMGTRCAVEVWSDDRARAEQAIESVFADMRRIDLLMSTWKPDTQLARVNQRAYEEAVVIDPELFELLATALDYSRETDGAFDITYASVGYLYDFRRHVHPDGSAISAALPGIDYRHVQLDRARRTVRFTQAGTRVDLGGIAKGHAVDRGIELLRAAGFDRAMVNSGGDTRIIGDRFGKPWIVGIRDPDNAAVSFLRMPLTDAAISTSGDYERYFDEGGQRYHHIIDPASGVSARSLRSATVIGPTALRTDALSTSVFVLGPERGIELINRLPDVDAVVVTPQKKVLYSDGLEPPPASKPD
ncbi:MAG TPA: FAD:protein FMN transferase [Steroidobacteraceae bacterium]|nr:FAD:protein FMN transferase [Steroidobacteraceae bacterium]